MSPGFRFSLDVSGMDQFNHLTTATARFFFTPSSKVVIATRHHETVQRNSCCVNKWISALKTNFISVVEFLFKLSNHTKRAALFPGPTQLSSTGNQ